MTIYHSKFDEVKQLVEANIPVLLSGGKGTGKSTLAMSLAETLDTPLYSITLTRQTTLGMLVGFINVNGLYIPSELYKAVTSGGIMLLEEINGADANVLLALNTIENGYISFPHHGIVKIHPDFRLIATQNPNTSEYAGRAKLDASTYDRFDEIEIDLDSDLEKSLVDPDVYSKISILREAIAHTNTDIVISMRDCIRLQKRKELELLDGVIEKLAGKSNIVIEKYHSLIADIPVEKLQQDCETLDELITLLESRND